MPIPQLRRKLAELSPIKDKVAAGVASLWKKFAKKYLTHGRWRALFGFLILGGALVVVVGGISLAVIFTWLSQTLPDPNNLSTREVAQSTQILDRDAKTVLYEIHGDEKRTVVNLADIPVYAQKATIAVEDREFYNHRGFRITSLVRAVLANAIARKKVQGGSTITQQLVKNAILTNQKSYARKIKELVLSYEIERRFSKDEILKLYFNEIPYGSSAYGIEAASQTYFGKSVRDIDLGEAALLAAIVQAPTYYSPYGGHQDELKNRISLVLDLMVTQGYITKDEASAAKAENPLARVVARREAIKAPHFVLYVKELLTDRYGERMVEQGGLRVITTLDWNKQQIAEKAVTDNIKKVEAAGGSNAALAALDPKTGDILAMVGSRDYFATSTDGNVNVITRPRQPGSSFKPIVYAAGFEKGYTPNTMLYDVATTFNAATKPYNPKNYDLREHGPVTVRAALAGSLNIPAVKMIYLTGVGTVIDFAERLGYTTFADRSRFGLAIVLGGAEVKPLDHVAAFAAFAADGTYHAPRALLKVEDSAGKVMDEWPPVEGTRVMDPEIARNVSDVLSDNSARAFIFGTKNYLTLPDRPVAAKTGTTNDFHDAWTVGYTPQLATVVWTGNNDNAEMKRGADGSQIAAPIWNQFMRESLKGQPVENFTKPQPIATGKPVLDGQAQGDTVVKIDRATGLLATDLTPPSFVEEHHILSAHNILYYVDKDNPRGPVPTNPQNDPEYAGWEAGVQAWVQKNSTSTNFENFTPPTGSDDIHIQANWPTVEITTPNDGATINARTIDVGATASALRGVRRVEYYLDASYVGTVSAEPWSGSFKIPNAIGVGYHTLEARAFDDVDNMGKATRQVNVTAAPEGAAVAWTSPPPNAVIKKSAFPYTLSAALGDTGGASLARIVIVSADGTYRHAAGSFTSPGNGTITANLSLAPTPGNYYIQIELDYPDGSSQTLPDQVQVTIQ